MATITQPFKNCDYEFQDDLDNGGEVMRGIYKARANL